MLYLGQVCVFFVSNGPEMDPRVRHILLCNKIFLWLIQEEQEVSYWQTGKLPRGGGGGGGVEPFLASGLKETYLQGV